MAPAQRVLLPTSIDTTLPLPEGVVGVAYDPNEPLSEDQQSAEGLVAWGVSPEWLGDAARRMAQVRWVQSLGVGAEAVLRAGFHKHVVITNGAGLHDAPVAEHALALMLACARRLDLHLRAQQEQHWSDLGGVQSENADKFTSLHGRHVVIWGFGGIGRTLADYCTMLGARVTGVATTSRTRGGHVVQAAESVDDLLPSADVVVMTLPGGPETRHAMSRSRLGLLQPHAWLVNVGRGSTVDEEALIEALRNRQLAGAALDVVEHEPLNADSQLWDLNSVLVTPHAAGGRPRGYQELVAHNARALLGEVAWRNTVRRAQDTRTHRSDCRS